MFKKRKAKIKLNIKPKNENVKVLSSKVLHQNDEDVVQKAINRHVAFTPKPIVKKTKAVKKTLVKTPIKKTAAPKTASGMTKDVMIELNTKTKKWTLRTTGSVKALKTFDTQKEAIEHGRLIAKNNKSEIRVKSKEGKVRAAASHRK